MLLLCFSVESTALRLITSLGSAEVQPQLSRIASESKSQSILAGESEELNRALVLTLARAMDITGRIRTKNSAVWFGQTQKKTWKENATSLVMTKHIGPAPLSFGIRGHNSSGGSVLDSLILGSRVPVHWRQILYCFFPLVFVLVLVVE